MRNPVLLTILLVFFATPLYAQEETSGSKLESHCYGKPLKSGSKAAYDSLKAVVFRPPEGHQSPSSAAVVVFHGGGWSIGSEEWAYGTARRFAEKGFVGIAVNYRLSDRKSVGPIDAMADARAAIRWARKNADLLGVSPNRIVAYGWSAGAHLAASTAIFSDSPPGEELSCIPNALILKSPALDLVNDEWFCTLLGDSLEVADYSPVEHVRSGLPPTLILEGETDTVTPIGGVRKFHDRMLDAENRCELVIYEGVGHLFTPSSEPDDGYPNPNLEVQAAAWLDVDEFLASLGFMESLR